jgi:hypothetical protein
VPVISEANIAVEKLGELEQIFDKADDIAQSSTVGPLHNRLSLISGGLSHYYSTGSKLKSIDAGTKSSSFVA